MNSINREMLLYALIIGLCIASNRIGNKGLNLHWSIALVVGGAFMLIFGLFIVYYYDVKINTKEIYDNAVYILLPAIGILITRPLVISGFQKGFPVTQFGILYPLFGMIFTILVGIFIYKEQLNIQQGIGILLAMFSIFLLK